MTYADDHASALADLTEAGTAVTFTRTLPGTYDPSTDTWSGGSTTTVAGYAMRVKGNPLQYQALELIQSESPTLLFTPSTYGEMPALGSQVTWNSLAYTVRAVDPVSPDGTAIVARVIVSR